MSAMHDEAKEGDVGVQVIWYDNKNNKNKVLTCTSNFNVCCDPDQLLQASARSGILQLDWLVNLLLGRNTQSYVECLTHDELDVAAALQKDLSV